MSCLDCNNHVMVFVDSAKKDIGSYSDSNFNYTLNNVPTNNRFSKISLVDIEFPKSYYMIATDKEAKFNVIEDPNGVPVAFTTTLESSRNYSAATLSGKLKEVLELDNGTTSVYTIVFDFDTGKFTIINDSVDFSFDFTTNPLVGKYLGFGPQVYSSNGRVLVSDRVTDLNRYTTIYLRSTLVKNGDNDTTLEALNMRNVDNFDLLTYQSSNNNWKCARNTNNRSHTFSLEDVDHKSIDLNGGTLSFSFLLHN